MQQDREVLQRQRRPNNELVTSLQYETDHCKTVQVTRNETFNVKV
jgi:hypothetical protein